MKKAYWHDHLAQYVLLRYPELRRHQPVPPKQGTCLILPPVQHYYRYLFLAKRPNRDTFKFGHGVFQLCEAANDFHQTVSNELSDPATGHRGGFRLDNPEVLESLDRAASMGVTILRGVEQPDDLMGYIHTKASGFAANRDGEIWLAVSAGRFDEARKQLAARRFADELPDDKRMQMFDMVSLSRLKVALEAGQDAVLAVLRDMERHNVKMLKLEQYWQPTPFPFETA